MDVECRSHLRELSKKKLESLNSEYEEFIQPRNSGFLTTLDKEKILRLKNWEQETTKADIYNFFFDIRAKAKSAMKDFQLLCDILTEEQLELIFGKTKKDTKPPFSQLLTKLLPTKEDYKKKKTTKKDNLDLKSKEWRKYLLSDITIKALLWYYESGIFQTFSHLRTIEDTIDAVSVMVTGKKQPSFRYSDIAVSDIWSLKP